MSLSRLLPLSALLIFAAAAALAADPGQVKAPGDASEPIDVKAEATEFRGKENIVIFTGSVTATRGSMTINSDRLEVHLKEGTREMVKIVAGGNVSVRREDVLATGAKAVYTVSEETVVLTGEPKVWRGPDAVEGETVIMNLKEERMEIKGQARVILNSPAKKKETQK